MQNVIEVKFVGRDYPGTLQVESEEAAVAAYKIISHAVLTGEGVSFDLDGMSYVFAPGQITSTSYTPASVLEERHAKNVQERELAMKTEAGAATGAVLGMGQRLGGGLLY